MTLCKCAHMLGWRAWLQASGSSGARGMVHKTTVIEWVRGWRMNIFYVPDTVVTGAEDDGVEVTVDEVAPVAASSCRTAEDTMTLRSSRDTVTFPDRFPRPTALVELPGEATTQQRT